MEKEWEKQAREIFKYRVMTDWWNDDPQGKRREIFIGNLIEDMTKALSSAYNQGRVEQAENDARIVESRILFVKNYEDPLLAWRDQISKAIRESARKESL